MSAVEDHSSPRPGSAATEGVDQTTLDRLLDLGVFAPVGFALEARTVVPELAAAGRRQIEFSRSLGRAAIRTIVKSLSTSGATKEQPRSTPSTKSATTAPAATDDGVIAGYDGLTAREIVARCPSASAAELSWMASQEQQGKNRVTVMRAIEKARGPERR